jgi:hypothetical protein
MKKQNRAKENNRAKDKGPQEKHGPAQQRFPACREIKVVTIREESSRPRYMENTIDSPPRISMLWNSVIARSPWFHQDKEHLICVCLDTKHKLKSFSLVSMGSLNEAIAHPREIFRPAVIDSAHSIIVAHNHCSGDPRPSRSDVSLTRRLFLVGELLSIPLLDHIIIGDDEKYFSFQEHPEIWPENGRAVMRLWKTLNGRNSVVSRRVSTGAAKNEALKKAVYEQRKIGHQFSYFS